jgi:hypothetical protein
MKIAKDFTEIEILNIIINYPKGQYKNDRIKSIILETQRENLTLEQYVTTYPCTVIGLSRIDLFDNYITFIDRLTETKESKQYGNFA